MDEAYSYNVSNVLWPALTKSISIAHVTLAQYTVYKVLVFNVQIETN
jgi:hypothetical protein